MSKIEMGKQYRTRDGRDVRVFALDGGGNFTVLGAILLSAGLWQMNRWAPNGRYSASTELVPHACDLIEVKPKITRTYWFCHTGNEVDCNGYGWTDKAEAEKWARTINRTVSITGPHTIEFTEGEGL